MYFPSYIAKNPLCKMTNRPGQMPHHAVKPVAGTADTVVVRPPVEARDQSQQLILPDPGFQNILVVPDAGVSLSRLHDPVQDEFAVIPAVKGQVVLFQLPGYGREHHRVHPLPQHRQHTDTVGRKLYRLSRRQLLQDQRQKLLDRCMERILYFFLIHYFHRKYRPSLFRHRRLQWEDGVCHIPLLRNYTILQTLP